MSYDRYKYAGPRPPAEPYNRYLWSRGAWAFGLRRYRPRGVRVWWLGVPRFGPGFYRVHRRNVPELSVEC